MEKIKKTKAPKSQLNVNEIKELITWAKMQKIASFQYQDLAVTFSPLAFIDEPVVQTREQEIVESKRTAEELKKDEDDILFHST